MHNSNTLKTMVKNKYAQIASQSNTSGCCGDSAKNSCCGSKEVEFSVLSENYSELDGYFPEADLNLGCGLPTQFAGINSGDIVADLGSGAGNDVFIARRLVGEKGKVIGIDMTIEMITKAHQNNLKLGFNNVDFRLGEIENLPIENNSIDVVISNCVLNLVPDKQKAFKEIFRILKPGGHICVSDIVINGKMKDELKEIAALYAGCISGALDEKEYMDIIKRTGFVNIEIKQRIETRIPDELLLEYISENDLKQMHSELKGIFSITVSGYKK